jgi:hypothetical protein
MPTALLGKQVEVESIIVILNKGRHSPIPPLRHVMGEIRRHHPRKASHDSII